MPRVIPAFASGGADDTDLDDALEWFLEFLGADDWTARVAAIEQNIESGLGSAARDFGTGGLASAYTGRDRIAWYLYLVDAAQRHPLRYEPSQGARILPVFKKLGAHLGLLRDVGGVGERVERLLGPERGQPDSGLFELLIALLWKRNDYRIVEFIPESPNSKTPDFLARSGRDKWFVECKRLQRRSEYSERERKRWFAMWTPFRQHLARNRISLVFDITFHVELDTLPDDYLMEHLAGKIQFLSCPRHIISTDAWDVSAKPVDYDRIRGHLQRYRVRFPSDQLQELVAGYRDPRRGFSFTATGEFVRLGGTSGANQFLDDLSFAAGSFWSCDAPEAIRRKARAIRKQLRRAVDQFPPAGRCAAHVGLETVEGPVVEEERFSGIMRSVLDFDALGKDLSWVYCHLFESYAPPARSYAIDETVLRFGGPQTGGDEPIGFRWAVLPEGARFSEDFHWRLAPP